MERPYFPIDCSVHDQLLAAATLRRECELSVAEPDRPPRQLRGIIADVYSRGGAEYLVLLDGETVRLDHITALNGETLPDHG